MADQYLSTDPAAGKRVADALQSPEYLSTKQDAGRVPGELGRVDSNAVGVDHDKLVQALTDAAVRHLPASMAPSAARVGTFIADSLASTLEMFSSPESIATGGTAAATRRLPQGVPEGAPTLPRTSYPQTQPGAVARVAGREIANSPNAGMVQKVVGKVMQQAPSTKTFQDLPLAQQMEHLPIQRVGTTTPYQAPSQPIAPPQTMTPVSVPVDSAAQIPAALAKMTLSAEEFSAAQAMAKRGIAPEAIKQNILALRALRGSLPTNAKMAQDVAARNAAGTWK